MMKRYLIIAASVAFALVVGVIAYLASGSSRIESWIGSQILAIGGSYLGPDLEFDKLTYIRPKTLVLDNLKLTSADPPKKGKQITILSVAHARLELAEIPQRGEPIRFSEIILDAPKIHLVASSAGESDLVGFSHFVKGSQEELKPESAKLAKPLKLSDVLQIRHVEITNGSIHYDSRKANRPPVWLDGIQARLDFSPAESSPQAGLYKIATTISRRPALDISLSGLLNIDTFTLSQSKTELTVDVQEKNNHFLPSELQNLLKEFEVNGSLQVLASGDLSLLDTAKSNMQTQAGLTQARVAIGKHRLAIDSWQWDVGIDKGVAVIRKGHAILLGGELGIVGTIPLNGIKAAQLELTAKDLRIQQLIRSPDPNEPPEYAGNVSTHMVFQAPLAEWNTQARGGGELSIRQGRLARIPVLSQITSFISNTISKTIGSGKQTLNDQADASFSFVDNRVEIERFSGTSGAVAMRGNGSVGFDQQMDLRINAGPLERLQHSLGAIGRVWGSVTDSVAGYRVTGPMSDPQIAVEIGR